MQIEKYDIAIVGGGLGGLTLAIKLLRSGLTVILIEKETYPFHKVCGEYISMESWQYLVDLGLDLSAMDIPFINRLVVSSCTGESLTSNLTLGGFGISRYKLDHALKKLAESLGAVIEENCKAEAPEFRDEIFSIKTNKGIFHSRVCCGSFGKRSNIDVKWRRPFVLGKKNKLNNYVGVKYHVKIERDQRIIALHNFAGGYCGISAIEEGKHCICYLTNAKSLATASSIGRLETEILSQNPHLQKILCECIKLTEPITISQISFERKTQVQSHVLLIGDAAGMITPLCGNGMSMAMHAGKIASSFIESFLKGDITRSQMETRYAAAWKKEFSSRLATGRLVQRFFGKTWQTNIFVSMMKKSKWLTQSLIALTHGKPY